MGKPRRGDRFRGLSYLRSGIPLRSIPCLGSVVPSAFRGFVAREAGVLTPQGGFGGQSPETRYALHRLPGVSSPLRGFPCRWGNSLPFREGLGVGFLPSLQGRVGERLSGRGFSVSMTSSVASPPSSPPGGRTRPRVLRQALPDRPICYRLHPIRCGCPALAAHPTCNT